MRARGRVVLPVARPRSNSRAAEYIVTLGHQAGVLPACGMLWLFGFVKYEISSLIYLLTGAYVVSDSIVNYSPVSGCVVNIEGPPHFSWAVHLHHFFTASLCALGSTLPGWLEDEGAAGIVVGEIGSMWITITLLYPTRHNFILRFYFFVISRAACVLIALHMAYHIDTYFAVATLAVFVIGILYDNARTLSKMHANASQAMAGKKVEVGAWPL